MKRKKINLDDDILYGDFKEAGDKVENSFIKMASVLYDFFLREANGWLKKKIDKEQLEELKFNSQVTGIVNNERVYSLNDDVRKEYLRKMIANNTLIGQLNLIEESDSRSFAAKHFLKFLRKDSIPLKKQNQEELALSMKVSKWVEDLDSEYPQPGQIYAEMKRRSLVRPFEELTQNFQGRTDQLEAIKEYVDWFPKKGFFNITERFVRGIFSWHEKKPLLITGIGGIGKSTLVAKFILDHIGDNNKLPFVYIDFDNSSYSIEEPLFVLSEALEQLKIQFSDSSNVFDAVINLLNDRVFLSNSGSKKRRSIPSFRAKIYRAILERLNQFRVKLSDIDKPILVVFDSFEELQYRGANKSEFLSFLKTIQEISEQIPRIRPVFVGRAEIEFGEIEFQTIMLKAFDRESSGGYLKKLGVENKTLRERIFVNFGGNPLTLRLAASLAKEEELATSQRLSTSKTGILFDKLDRSVAQRELVVRNLDHIHDVEVRKIAMPGLLVRKVNEDIIKEVLAEPCGLGKIDKKDASRIFEGLARETFLLQSGSNKNELVFRADLRKAMEDYIVELDAENAGLIHNNAIAYYKNRKSPENQAEYLYHRLKRGDDPEFITKEIYSRVSNYLDRSLDELPLTAQVYLAELRGRKISEEKLKKVKIRDWESYYAKIIRDGLRSDLSNLESIRKELKFRKERSYGGILAYWEAKLFQRLFRLSKSTEIIEKAIRESKGGQNPSDDETFLRLSIVKVENLEYQLKFEEALKLFRNIVDQIDVAKFPFINFQLWVLRSRLFYRLDIEEFVENEMLPTNIDFQKNDTYKSYLSYYNTSQYGNEFPFNTLDEAEYKKNLRRFRSEYNSLEKLEDFTSTYIGGSLQELTEPGKYDVIVLDIFNRANKKLLDRSLAENADSWREWLVSTLAKLYPTIASAKRLLEYANIYSQSINFHVSSNINWHNILTEVEKMNSLEILLSEARRDYPQSTDLKRIDELRKNTADASSKYKRLTKKLSELYPSMEDSRSILKYAGLSDEEIQIDSGTDFSWQNLIESVEYRGNLNRLLQAIVETSADNEIVELIRNETSYDPLVNVAEAYRKELNFNRALLNKLIRDGKLDEVFTRLESISKDLGPSFQNEITLLLAQYHRYKRDNINQIITRDEYNLRRSRIIRGLINLINKIEEESDIQDIVSKSSGLQSTFSESRLSVTGSNELERVFQNDDFVGIKWLQQAMEASRAVCKIELGNDGIATGFLVANNYLMTNHHVIPNKDAALGAHVIFHDEDEGNDHKFRLPLVPERIFITNQKLDYTLVALSDNDHLGDIKPLKINPDQLPRTLDSISMIQSHSGQRRKSIIADTIVSVWPNENIVHYHGNTESSSSGSPVFNRNWEVIAIHHAFGKKTLNDQNDQLFVNEGILMRSIVEDLKNKGILID